MNGLALVGGTGITEMADLRGGRIGTYRGDTLETLAYAAAIKAGIEGDVHFVYFTDPFESLTALRAGDLQAITHVEPFVSQLVAEGFARLTTGEATWGTDHPDCVLVTTEKSIKSHRDELKQLIYEMAKAQKRIETNPEEVAELVAKPFYKMEAADLVAAVHSQFPAIDIRGLDDFIIEKSKMLVQLGYIGAPSNADLFDFSLLDEVIAKDPELFNGLKKRYVPERQPPSP